MTIMELGALGEFLGFITVLATLVYLAVQLNQTKHSMQSASHHSAIASMNQNTSQVATDRELMEIVNKGILDQELAPIDWFRFGLWLTGMFHVFQLHYLDSEKGLGDSRIWSGEQRAMKELLGNAGVARWWREMPSLPFSEEFKSHVDSILASAGESEQWRLYRMSQQG